MDTSPLRQSGLREPSPSVSGDAQGEYAGHVSEGSLGDGERETETGTSVGGATTPVTGDQPRRRGRPPGSKSKQHRSDSNAQDLEEPRKRGVVNSFVSAVEGLFGAVPDEDEEPAPKHGTRLPTGGSRPSKGKSKLELDEDTVGEGICALMAFPAVIGQAQDGYERPWWIKDAQQVRPISAPLTRMLNAGDPALVRFAQKYGDYLFLLAGVSAVVGPSVRMEMAFRAEVKEMLQQSAPRSTARTHRPAGAVPPYAVDTAADAAASRGGDGDAAPADLFPNRTRLRRVNLARPDGFGMDRPEDVD